MCHLNANIHSAEFSLTLLQIMHSRNQNNYQDFLKTESSFGRKNNILRVTFFIKSVSNGLCARWLSVPIRCHFNPWPHLPLPANVQDPCTGPHSHAPACPSNTRWPHLTPASEAPKDWWLEQKRDREDNWGQEEQLGTLRTPGDTSRQQMRTFIIPPRASVQPITIHDFIFTLPLSTWIDMHSFRINEI